MTLLILPKWTFVPINSATRNRQASKAQDSSKQTDTLINSHLLLWLQQFPAVGSSTASPSLLLVRQAAGPALTLSAKCSSCHKECKWAQNATNGRNEPSQLFLLDERQILLTLLKVKNKDGSPKHKRLMTQSFIRGKIIYSPENRSRTALETLSQETFLYKDILEIYLNTRFWENKDLNQRNLGCRYWEKEA